MKLLFEKQEVQKLLRDFQALVGVRIAIFDQQTNELYASSSGKDGFCALVRRSKKINDTCHQCDQKAFKHAAKIGGTYVYACHLGLYEAITPVYDNGMLLGYIMIGQIVNNATADRPLKLVKQADAQLNLEEEAIKKALSSLKRMTINEIKSASSIMRACAASIWLDHIVAIERAPVAARIEDYVIHHLGESLSTQEVCQALNIGKTTIYKTLKAEYNLSLMQFIEHIRMERAKALLKESDEKVSDIAAQVGYSDYNYFSRRFKAAYHMTPSAYRKRNAL